MVRSRTRSSLSLIVILLVLQFHHIFFEPVVADFPFAASVHQPLLSRRQHSRIQPAGAYPAFLLASDQSAALERPQMLEHCRQAHGERLGQFADRCRSACQPGEHSTPGRVRKGLEGAIEPGRFVKHTLNYRVAWRESRQLSVCLTKIVLFLGKTPMAAPP